MIRDLLNELREQRAEIVKDMEAAKASGDDDEEIAQIRALREVDAMIQECLNDPDLEPEEPTTAIGELQ